MYSRESGPRCVVAGVDFSPGSLAAARWAALWLVGNDELVLVHSLVVPEYYGLLAGKYPLPQSILDNARAGAERRLREFAEGLPVSRVSIDVREGRPADSIAAVARDHQADLIVVGKHGERGENAGYTGRTADSLVRSSPAAVLMADGMPGSAPKRIVVPLTYSSITPLLIERVRDIQWRSGADIIAVHVIGSAVLSHVLSMSNVTTGDPPDADGIEQIFAEERDHWKDELAAAGIPRARIASKVVFGEVSDAVIAEINEHRADMIIMGSHAGPVRRLLLGSAATAVLRQAEVPVLVVVEPDHETEQPSSAIADEVRDAAAVFAY